MGAKSDKEVREKLVSRGVSALTDQELMSILVGEGTDSLSAVELARQLLEGSSLSELASNDLRNLRMKSGLGIKRAAVLNAAFELGRRMRAEEADQKSIITSSQDVVELFEPILSSLKYEEFWVVYLNSANRIVDKIKVSQGGVTGTVVDHKLIVKRAIELLSPAVIIVHNHPSGVAKPSLEDIEMTQKLILAASLFDIKVLDHLIIAHGTSLSFRKEGIIE